MSEDDVSSGMPRNTDARRADSPSAPAYGARLAAARESAGLGVGDVATHLRLHVNQVRALEAGNLAALPEAAYVRGFIRNYARMVKLDPAPLLDDFSQAVAPAGESVVDGMTRTRDYSPVKAAARERVSRIAVLGIAVVALAALGVVGWYATQPTEPADSGQTATPPPSAPASAAPVEPASTASATTEPATQPADEAARESAAPAVDVAVTEAPSTPAALLMLRFSGVSWAEVTDAKGAIVLSQLVQPGEVHALDGAAPLNVIIGDASKVEVTVRGEPFDLAPVTRANVARFSVK